MYSSDRSTGNVSLSCSFSSLEEIDLESEESEETAKLKTSN